MWYFDQAGFDGTWHPALTPDKPKVKDGRLVHSDTTGPRVRAVSQLGDGHEKLTLAQLREVYSPDGLFYATARAGV